MGAPGCRTEEARCFHYTYKLKLLEVAVVKQQVPVPKESSQIFKYGCGVLVNSGQTSKKCC